MNQINSFYGIDIVYIAKGFSCDNIPSFSQGIANDADHNIKTINRKILGTILRSKLKKIVFSYPRCHQ